MEIKTVDKKFYRELGQVISGKRREKNISLRKLAQYVGTTAQTLDYIELGLVKVSDDRLEKICEALDITNLLTVEVKLGL